MKKHFRAAVLLALLSCAALVFAVQGGWKEYVYADDGFAISAPAQPSLDATATNTPIGAVDAHNYTLDLGSDAKVGVSTTDLKMGQELDAKMVIGAVKMGLAEQLGGKIVSEKEVSLGSNSGIEVEIVTDTSRLRLRYFFIGGRLFALMSTAPLAKSLAPETARIFDSFRLVAGGNK